MNKFFITAVFICSIVGTSSASEEFSNYRSSPFQWVHPEYYYKAKIINVQNDKYKSNGQSKIAFFGLSAKLPAGYEKSKKNISDTTIGFRSSLSKKSNMVISINDEAILLGTEFSRKREKDYYSAFNSAKEWYHKLFTLTPDIVNEKTFTGDLWLIHGKGMLFEHIKKIAIYKGNNFTAYASFYKKDNPYLDKEIILFHEDLPEDKYISMGFRNVNLNVRQFLATLEIIK